MAQPSHPLPADPNASRERPEDIAPFTPLESAPIDDEPETDAERAAVAEARAELSRGVPTLTTEELRRRLGL